MKNYILVIFLFILFIFSAFKIENWYYRESKGFPKYPYPKNYSITFEGIELGKTIFNDKRLSLDNTIACSSCHLSKYAFADTTSFSVGINNQIQKRNTLPLFNLAWNKSFFWDGRIKTIEEQVSIPINHSEEMASSWNMYISKIKSDKNILKLYNKTYNSNTIDSNNLTQSLAQYLLSLVSNKSKFDSVVSNKINFTSDEYLGFELVNDASRPVACLNCHKTEPITLGTNFSFANTGLNYISNTTNDLGMYEFSKNEADKNKFKVPSLRNLKFTAPYMHDGRFKTLEEVIDYYSSSVPADPYLDSKISMNKGKEIYSKEEKKRIIAFLNTMNDYEFVK